MIDNLKYAEIGKISDIQINDHSERNHTRAKQIQDPFLTQESNNNVELQDFSKIPESLEEIEIKETIKTNETEVVKDVDQALNELGGFGTFQINITMIYFAIMVLGSYSLYPIAFYELQPDYLCQSFYQSNNSYSEWYKCTNIDFCSQNNLNSSESSHKMNYRIDYDSPSSLYNWIEQLNLQCASKNNWGLFGSLFFSGVVIGSLTLPRVSDYYGRKKIFLFSSILHLFLCILIIISTNFYFSISMMFIIGIAFAGRTFVGYIWMNEFMRVQDASTVTIAIFFAEGLAIFFASFYFLYFSRDWRGIFALPLIPMTVGIFVLIQKTDAPKFYYGIGDYETTRQLLTQIGIINGKLQRGENYIKKFEIEINEQIQKKFNQIQQQSQIELDSQNKVFENEKVSVKNFLKDYINTKNCFLFGILCISINFNYMLINFYVKYIPGNIYINNICISLADSFGNFGTLILLRFFSTKASFLTSFIICIIFSIILALGEQCLNSQSSICQQSYIIIPIGVIGVKLGNTCAFCFFYFGTIQYFSSQYLGLVMGFTNVLGRLSTVASPIIAEQITPVPMIVSIFVTAVAIIACIGLQQPNLDV